MRPLLHLVSIVLVLPSVLLAAAFVILGRAIATRSLLGLLGQLLTDALWIVPWGALAAVTAIVLIATGGFFVQTRRFAGLCVALLGLASIVVVLSLMMTHSRVSVSDLPFFIPGVIAIGIGLWLGVVDRNGRLPSSA